MAMTDPVGDLLTRIRNGQSARLESVTVPASRMRSNVLDVLQREGYIRGWFEEELRPGIKELRVELKYDNGRPVIKEIPPAVSKQLWKIKMRGQLGSIRCTQEPVPMLVEPLKEFLQTVAGRRNRDQADKR